MQQEREPGGSGPRAGSIAEKVDACLQAFKYLRQCFNASEDESDLTTHDDLVDVLGRFRVWAGNIAAHRTGQSSLDHRLRDSSELKETVLSFLEDLSEVLESGS